MKREVLNVSARHPFALTTSLLFMLAFGAAPALTQTAPAGERVRAEPDERPRTFVDLRLGATSTETWTQVCAAGYPLEMLAIEACGNGSGFLHNESAPEIAHFRGKARLLQQALGPVYVEPWVGFGFADPTSAWPTSRTRLPSSGP